MSFSDAISQIDQIVQWEQQVGNPATATQTSSTSSSGSSSQTASTSATSTSSFADTLAGAQASTEASTASVLDPTSSSDSTDATGSSSTLLGGGDSQLLASLQSMEASTSTDTSDSTDSTDAADSLASLDSADSPNSTGSADSSDTELDDLASTASQQGTTSDTATALNSANVTDTTNSGATGGQATNSSDPRILAMTEEANSLVGKPYVWGGGHDGWGATSGYDCSGFVSAVLHAGGYLSDPQDTATLPSAGGMEQGAGQYVTIYDRDTPGTQGHVIISINGQFYESGGEHGSWGGGGGVEEIATPSAAYLATFNNVLHPAGL